MGGGGGGGGLHTLIPEPRKPLILSREGGNPIPSNLRDYTGYLFPSFPTKNEPVSLLVRRVEGAKLGWSPLY